MARRKTMAPLKSMARTKERETGGSSNLATTRARSKLLLPATSVAHDVAKFVHGWRAFLDYSSNLLANFEWDRTFWHWTNPEETTQVLAVHGNQCVKGAAQLWVIGTLESPSLQSPAYGKGWSIGIFLDREDRKILKAALQKHGIWEEPASTVNFSARKDYVNEQLRMMDDQSSRQYLEDIVKSQCYPFTYDGTRNSRPDPGHSVSQFTSGKTVAVEFQIHSWGFVWSKDYSFCLQSIYLVEEKKPEVSTPKHRKRGPDEWMMSPPRTRQWNPWESPLEWVVPSRSDKDGRVIEITSE